MHRKEYAQSKGHLNIEANGSIPADAPPFYLTPIYSVFAKHPDLEDLTHLAMVSKRGYFLWQNLLHNQPQLFLDALLKMSVVKISAFLQRFPDMTQHIINLTKRIPTNVAVFTLWTMIAVVDDISDLALGECIDYYSEHGNNMPVLQQLRAINLVKAIKEKYQSLDAPDSLQYKGDAEPLLMGACYLNMHGLLLGSLLNHQACLELDSIDFSGANLRNVVFNNVLFNNVSFRNADLTGAVFNGKTRFRGTIDFRGANLTNTTLSQIQLRGIFFLTLLLDGACLDGTIFLPNQILTAHELQDLLNDLPFPYLNPSKESDMLDKKNALIILPRLLENLISNISSWTQEDYVTFRMDHMFGAGYNIDIRNTTLSQYKQLFIQKAMQLDYFAKHRSMGMHLFNDFLKLGFTRKNMIYTSSQRELNRVRQELPEGEEDKGEFGSFRCCW